MATLGKNQVFEIKNGDGTSFHNLVLRKSAVESIVMSLGDKISGDVYYKDNSLSVTMHEYITYNGVNYMLVNPPTIVREGIVSDNSELKGMTKYSFVFYHPMYQLANFPFTDVAVTSDETRYLSEGKTFPWIGKPADFVAKLNKNLTGTEWIVEISSRFPQDKLDELSNVIQFNNATIADACKTFYDTWGVPYVVDKVASTEASYATGKRFKLVMGLPSNEIYEDESARQLGTPYVFQMGHGVGLKNNSRTPRNNKIVTRIAGYGSEDNVPYGYPQIVWTGNQDWDYTINNDPDNPLSYPIYKGIVGGQYVKLIKHPFTRTHLMPSIFTETVNKKVNPNADGYDPTIEIKDYYDAVATQEYPYVNEINLQAPSYESHEFTDIKPELDADRSTGIVSAVPLNSDLTPADHWDDAMDDDGNYLQSYFQITLPQLSFDLYACAAITQEMQINMRSGACIGCTFPVQVDWDDYKRNFYDEEGNFVPDGEQRDLTKYPKSNLGQISVVVQKDNTTFGTLMPNIYQQPKANDLFVFIGISLPLSYIADAEERLDDAMKTYMLENNVYYFDYPLKFDEHFLATHTYILEQIRPNSIIRFDYGGIEQQLFVKQLTVKYGNAPLPQYDITLTDNVEVVLNQIGQVADDVEKLSSLIAVLRQSYNRNVWNELAKKLSKTQDDTAAGYITMLKGLQVGANFVPDILGEGGVLRMNNDGKVELVVDTLYARMRAYFDSVVIREYRHESGNRIKSPAQGFNASRVEYIKVVDNAETIVDDASEADYFRCYWRVDDGEKKAENQFVGGDLAFCEHSDIVNGSLVTKRYWRVVTGRNVGNTTTADGEAWIDLSNAHNASGNPVMTTITYEGQGGTTQTKSVLSFESGSDIPEAHDDICMLGCVTDSTRQGAIIEYVSGTNAPSYQIYQSIGSDDTNPYVLTNKNQITICYNSATGKADMKVYGDFYVGDKSRENGYAEYDSDTKTLKVKGKIHVESGSVLDDGRELNEIGTKRGNLLLNSGFTGDYDSETVADNMAVDEFTEMFSDALKNWINDNVTIIDSNDAVSGKAAVIGTLQQSADGGLNVGEWYVLSFCAKGSEITFSVGGVSDTLTLTNSVKRYDIPFICTSNEPLKLTGLNVTIMDIQLMAGNIPTEWTKAHKDNDRSLAEFQSIQYLLRAVSEASTDIIGGLILSQILKVGNYRMNQQGKYEMYQETGGMSGAYNDDNSPFTWGGGSMEQAIYTIMKYADNPKYQATEAEVARMAKYVVTHGGRAILNDVILRGYIYALGGVFNEINVVNSFLENINVKRSNLVDVNISGNIYTPYFVIDNNNYQYYIQEEKYAHPVYIEGGKYMDSNGNYQTSSSMRAEIYAVTGNTNYAFSGKYSSTHYNFISWLDKDQEFISSPNKTENIYTDETVQAPSNAAFALLNVEIANSNDFGFKLSTAPVSSYSIRLDDTGLNIQWECSIPNIDICMPINKEYIGAEANIYAATVCSVKNVTIVEISNGRRYRSYAPTLVKGQTLKLKCIYSEGEYRWIQEEITDVAQIGIPQLLMSANVVPSENSGNWLFRIDYMFSVISGGLSVTRSSTGRYRVTFPSTWHYSILKTEYYCMIQMNSYDGNNASLVNTVYENGLYSFDVKVSNTSDVVDGDFGFSIWAMPSPYSKLLDVLQ